MNKFLAGLVAAGALGVGIWQYGGATWTADSVAVETPAAAPAFVSADRVDRIRAHFQAYADEGKLKGLTTLVAEKGEIIHFETYGMRDAEAGDPTGKDTIYRIYSMTKPITGVALMMLYEEGRFALDDPISKYMPELGNPQVYVSGDSPENIVIRPASREVTIRDVMTHTAGYTYGIFGNHPVDQVYQQLGVLDAGADATELTRRLGQAPLMFEPGTRWHYSVAVDVQGRLVEVLSGQKFSEFLQERLFEPLGMNDTVFWLPEDKMHRLSAIYQMDENRNISRMEGEWGLQITEPPLFESGGGGLLSTMMDYWRFAQMLANDGELDGVRILQPETVKLMATNHLPESAPRQNNSDQGGARGTGFGLDFAVIEDPSMEPSPTVKGNFHWAGAAGTIFWIDPTNDLVVIMMTNLLPFDAWPTRDEFRTLVYGDRASN